MKFYNLQLLRFFAATAVILFHNVLTGYPHIDFLISKGDFAVSVFFILSGYVISNSLVSKPTSFKIYFRKRFQKIFPLWIFSLILYVAVTGKLAISFFRVFLSVSLLQSLFPSFTLDLNFVGWSLSVEFLMYLLMYLVIVKWDIMSRSFEIATWLVWLITQVAFIYFLKSGLASSGSKFNYYNFQLYNPIWHINEFLLGMLLTKKMTRDHTSKFFTYRYATLITVLGYLLFISASFYIGLRLGVDRFYHNGFLAPVTGVFIIFLVMIEKKKNAVKNKPSFRNKLFDLLGAISFGMYLFHMSVYYVMNRYMNVSHGLWNFLVYYLAVIAFSYLAYRIIERGYIKISEGLFGTTKKNAAKAIQTP